MTSRLLLSAGRSACSRSSVRIPGKYSAARTSNAVAYATASSTAAAAGRRRLLWTEPQRQQQQRQRVVAAERAIAWEERREGESLLGWVWRVNVPKGFENFYPKNRGGASGGGGKKPGGGGKDAKEAAGSSSKKAGEANDKKNPLGDFGKKNKKAGEGFGGSGGGSSGSGGDGGGGGSDAQQAGVAAGLLLAVLAARSYLDDESNGGLGSDGREVTWSDFRNYMLEPNDVERVVVVNKKTARVYLRPGARGVPQFR
eukprot:CAMPEP_0113554782 /NCGR_PEP_ID=MMETSP0015_2-20120614/16346_1 /TAXON_ID=2838 /ORGANISM="Odontella" /LENGTH=255 /DNA_ID=CAMNT_0000455973 /DNA_START=87 /DNA_END=851 /DNA_ORIENTATION=+ /assembly_acc=CAM_ASM_000160